MVRHHTQVWNRTDAKIEVKEGNGGIFNKCIPLLCNTKYEVKIESDTTYRTYKVLRVGETMNSAHYVDLDSDYLTDHKIVYIRINEHGKCYKDGIPRETKSETKEIVNTTGQTITIKETANLPDQVGRLTLFKQLKHNESHKVNVIDPGNRTRVARYTVEIARKGSQATYTEITADDFISSSYVGISMAADGASLEKRLIGGGHRADESPPTSNSFRRSLTWSTWFKSLYLYYAIRNQIVSDR